jgi:predicted Zn-dependent protease
MSPLTRRRFLIQGSASLAGALIATPILQKLVAVVPAAAATAPSTEFPGEIPDVFASIVADLEKQFPYASALFTSTGGTTIRRDRQGKNVSESPFRSRGVSLRVFDGAVFHEAAVGSTSPDDLRATARDLKRDVTLAKEQHRIEPLAAMSRAWRPAMVTDPDSVSLAERAALVDREFERCNWNDPRVRNVTVSTTVDRIQRVFVDRTRRLSSHTWMIGHVLAVFGFDKGHPGFSFVRNVGQGGLELASLSAEQIERSRRETVEMFTAGSVPAGEYEVILAPEVSGLLAHESFGHGVEMDQFAKHRAKAQEYLGKPVASKIVSMFDDPSVEGARGHYPFDDEGMIAAPTKIIEDGVFRRPLTDLASSIELGTGRSPNGRTQGWDRKVYPRMSNTFFARGTADPAEMLASLADGLYLEGFRNGIEDPQGWGIQFTASRAREVKNGKFTGRVFAPATVTGYVPDILSNITMVGSDFALEPGSCGKGFKEFVPVSAGGPSLRTRARVS